MIEYDVFTGAFLAKITEFDFASILDDDIRTEIVDGYMKAAIANFSRISKIDFSSNANDYIRAYEVEVDEKDVDELLEVISEGMVVQWLKPYIYSQELLQQTLNTRDFTTYSPAELLKRVSAAYQQARKDFKNMMYDYSYNHGDLTGLHI